MALVLAVVALILALASAVFTWEVARRTEVARGSSPGELVARMLELEQEWSSVLDANAKYTRRLAERDKRLAKSLQDAPGATNATGPVSKSDLRMKARQLRIGGT